ncbi:MAG: hypothetical protein IPJ85_01715 [Flavobacteriales bacterium]|nr:hypothetical protein [Flavobacteriales bacterium]
MAERASPAALSALLQWHWSRWLRLLVGLAFIGEGIASGDAFAFGAGAFFGLQAVLNSGCCFAGTCAPSPARKTNGNEELTYHEIK